MEGHTEAQTQCELCEYVTRRDLPTTQPNPRVTLSGQGDQCV